MSEKKGRLETETEAEPAAKALWMFMFRFVLTSGLLEHDTRLQEQRHAKFSATSSASSSSSAEEKGKRKKPHSNDNDNSEDKDSDAVSKPWVDFLIGARLHDPRLTLHIAAFAGPKWEAVNPYEEVIVQKTEALVEWEKHVAAMKEVSQGFEELKKNPGEPLRRFEAVLDKHRLPSVMGELGDHVRTIVQSFGRKRPRFNIWRFATDARKVSVNRRWVSYWDWEITKRRQAASDALLRVDPWRDVRSTADAEGSGIASDEFLVERFWLWDAKFRFANELRALNQARASKQLHEHGLAVPKKRTTKLATSTSPVFTGESLVIVEDTETEEDVNA